MEDGSVLDALTVSYGDDPFRWTTEIMLSRYVDRCVACSANRDTYLELGIGHGIVLSRLSREFRSVVVLEGSAKLIEKHRPLYPSVSFVQTMFEAFQPERRYDQIGMGFVLEHVEDPGAILRRYRDFLSDDGRAFIGVPSASSMHRILGHKAGLLDDIRRLSAQDLLYGHRRYLTYDDWRSTIEAEGLRITRAEGLFLAPFSTAQLASLNLDNRVLLAMGDLAREYPSLANSLFFEVRRGG